MQPKDIQSVKILAFSKETLSKSLANEHISAQEIPIVKKKHFDFLLSYLGESGLNASTIVVEYPYISKSYLNDFASYYSLCFDSYSKYCKRIHFFKEQFSKETFNSELFNSESNSNRIFTKESESYLGNVVAKPLPEAIIGPTLLKTYNNDASRIYTTKKYHVNLYGKKISFESLVYQEQDTVVSACATTAIWSAFHKAFKLFQTPIPNPNEITSSAGNLFFSYGRSFPNHGLDQHQIGNAIHSVGLVSEFRDTMSKNITDIDNFKSFISAYLRMGIPILLGIRLPQGLHLITISGLKVPSVKPQGNDNWPGMRFSKVDKIYAHDDQTGPFAKMEFDDSQVKNKLITSWTDKNNNPVNAEIISVNIPLHGKIRITYEDLYTRVRKINKVFSFVFPDKKLLTWDIYLEFGNTYKKKIRDSDIPKQFKSKIQFAPYPKHIWVATMYYEDNKIIDFIYDTTGLERSFFCIAINIFEEKYKIAFEKLFELENIQTVIESRLGEKYLKMFKQTFS